MLKGAGAFVFILTELLLNVSHRTSLFFSGPSNFWLLLFGQTVASISNLLLWGGPSYVAGIWFPSAQRGIASAIGGALAPQVYTSIP